MGKYTSDRRITVKDSQGRVVDDYVARDQIDPVKAGSAALGPVLVVLVAAFLLLSVLPVLIYALYLWHFARLRKVISPLSEGELSPAQQDVLTHHRFANITALRRSSLMKLGCWTVFGGLLVVISEMMIFTGHVAWLSELSGVTGLDDIHRDNLIERVFAVYQQVGWLIITTPLLLAMLFTPNERCIQQLMGLSVNRWLVAATLPYKLVYFIAMKPVTLLYRLMFGSRGRAALTAVMLVAATAGYQFQLSGAAQETDEGLDIITGTFSALGNDRALILREVEAELSAQNKEINGYYGAVEPISTVLAGLVKVSGSAELSRYWLWSDYAPQSVMTQLVRGYNVARYPVKTFKFRLALWQALGGDMNQTDAAGLRPWAYTSSIEGYDLLTHLGIELTAQEKAVVYLNIQNDVMDFSGRQQQILQALRP